MATKTNTFKTYNDNYQAIEHAKAWAREQDNIGDNHADAFVGFLCGLPAFIQDAVYKNGYKLVQDLFACAVLGLRPRTF
jgi:hypothetical protein